MQMGTDIRKPKSSAMIGIQRARDSTTVSTTTTGSDAGRGGGGNELDEEEGAGDYEPGRGFPLDDEDDDDIQRDRDYLFHQAELEAARRAAEEEEDSDEEEEGPSTWRGKLKKSWVWIKQFVVPSPSSTTVRLENPQAALMGPNMGVTFTQQFKAPPGKRTSSSARNKLIARYCRSCARRTKSLLCQRTLFVVLVRSGNCPRCHCRRPPQFR
jgi:hypothetical protein